LVHPAKTYPNGSRKVVFCSEKLGGIDHPQVLN
jgi:hypothetical protein